MQAEMPVRTHDYAVTRKLQWLALSLTPGVGAGRGRKLVEMYGAIDRVFAASLTELEGAGLPSVAAQSLALGKSMDLANAEFDHARELGAQVIVPGDADVATEVACQ
jgi:predicted Rossmann fold nucleotide-binding protein DprA/Smf involved in DNA uptake